MRTFSTIVLFVLLLIVVGTHAPTANAQMDSFGGPPIDYMTAEVNDPAAQLFQRIERGEVTLRYDQEHGYLKSLLSELDIPISSQVLVFSKTSLQLQRISPRRPRALYFNDDVYVGWCQHGDIVEVAATDAKQGATFYSVKQTPPDSLTQPVTLDRDKGVCLSCHASHRTQNVPGYLVRSVFADYRGQPAFSEGTFITDQTSPFKERWGGWYVSGRHGDMRHMGNVLFKEDAPEFDYESGANVQRLDDLFPTAPYLSPHSDIVALMVLEHQTQMHNAIAWANYETRRALYQSREMNKLLDRAADYVSESAERRIKNAAENVVRHLLMCDEFPLSSPVSGVSDFQREFAARGIQDSSGRTLREFDLERRLFRYPCSYLIYSPAFDGMPDEVRGRVLTRLNEVLDGDEDAADYVHLTSDMRREILSILKDTKPAFREIATATSR